MYAKATLMLLGTTLLFSGGIYAAKQEHHQRDGAWYKTHQDELAEEHRKDVAKRQAYWDAHKTVSDASEHQGKKNKSHKQKSLPPGLAKKYERTGELPPGWQKKIAKGEVLGPELYPYAREVSWGQYPNIPYDERSKLYEIENKVFRVMNNTHEILDVFQ